MAGRSLKLPPRSAILYPSRPNPPPREPQSAYFHYICRTLIRATNNEKVDTTEIIVVSTMGFALAWQLFYWAFFMFRIRKRPRDLASALPPVSVVVCARNEDENLKKLIPALVGQKYAAEKQIVIVDDCSTDDTPLILAQLRAKYPEVYTTTIPGDAKFKHGKKLALNVGIKAAKFGHIVFTDADCLPASDNWLTLMMEGYATEGKEMVLGYGRYAKRPGLLNLLLRYEAFWNAVQYFGMARALKPFMGVGRNLSYTKGLFDRSSKFREHLYILSGDDDLFVSEMGTRANTEVVYEAPAHTVTEPRRTWLSYSAQKSRHLTTASLYPAAVKFWLGVEVASRLLFWLSVVAAVVLGALWGADALLLAAGAALLVRAVVMYVAMGLAARAMGESKMWLLALPMDIVIPCMQSLAWLTGVVTQSRNTWK